MLSLGIIVLFILAALFAYPLATDDSENANSVLLELATKPPGYTATFLVEKSTKKERSNLFRYLLYGKRNPEKLIPVTAHQSIKIIGDSVRFDQYISDEMYVNKIEPLSKYKMLGKEMLDVRKITYRFGTDRYGRDVWSRLLLGTRVSLAVGFIAVILSISIGLFLGACAGYFGGKVDSFIVWLINVVWSIPTLLLVFAITFILGKGFWQIFIAVGLTMWVGTARLIRGQVMGLKELDYVQAAKTMGFSHARIIFKHILPNVIGPTIVLAASNFATAILIEAGLSFLGIGVQPPTASWGLMIKENYNFIITNRPMLAIVPGIAIMIIVLAFNLLGNGLRDAFDVKERV